MNMITIRNSGTTWSYTYNEYGLLETIGVTWGDIPTDWLLRITYKQIGVTGIIEKSFIFAKN